MKCSICDKKIDAKTLKRQTSPKLEVINDNTNLLEVMAFPREPGVFYCKKCTIESNARAVFGR